MWLRNTPRDCYSLNMKCPHWHVFWILTWSSALFSAVVETLNKLLGIWLKITPGPQVCCPSLCFLSNVRERMLSTTCSCFHDVLSKYMGPSNHEWKPPQTMKQNKSSLPCQCQGHSDKSNEYRNLWKIRHWSAWFKQGGRQRWWGPDLIWSFIFSLSHPCHFSCRMRQGVWSMKRRQVHSLKHYCQGLDSNMLWFSGTSQKFTLCSQEYSFNSEVELSKASWALDRSLPHIRVLLWWQEVRACLMIYLLRWQERWYCYCTAVDWGIVSVDSY